jgi:alpha-tubulin suppressor-like RCC1 family protein
VCWGYGQDGELGNGSSADSPTPVAVSGLTDAVSLGVGSGQDCAVKQDHSVVCWGYGAYGSLGNGMMGANSDVPVAVAGLAGASSLAGQLDTECALVTGNAVQCWGYGPDGELGNGASMSSATAVAVSGLQAVQSLGGGWYHACAVVTGGKVQCWGMGTSGQLGNGNTASSNLPVQVLGFTGAVQVSGGQGHTCALESDSSVWCWGDDTYGQLGNGQMNQMTAQPVLVEDIF